MTYRKGCQSTCERKSECNPGWDSDEFSEHDSCPLNVCCSKHGWCGYTEEFCGDDKVDRPSCSASKEVSRVIGYYEAWAPAKRAKYSMLPEEIPYGQYTHIIFSFATINPSTFKVSAGDDQTENFMSRISSIKLVQPDIKIWVALGGWAFNDPGPTQTTFSDIASSKANTNTFLDSLVQMMNKYGFDGVDIDWEYPVADDRHGKPEDYKNIVTFMKAIKNRMADSKRGVSMAIPASYWYLQNFDIKALEAQVDWFNIMSYDVHGSWDIDNEWTGPWVNSHTNMTEIQMALDLLWRNDISPKKVTMGMAFYSRSFTLTDPGCSGLGCRVSSGGNAGVYSDTVGVLLHPEIQDIIADKKLTPTLDRTGAVKLVHWDDQWVSFDDVATWRLKANIARSQCIEGFMVWAMSQDDDKGTNIKGLNQALGRKTPDFPDFTPIDKPVPPPQPAMAPKLCRWSSCFEGCPSGFKEVQRDGHKEIMMDTNICNDQGHGFARLCCPSSHPLPTCTWRGHRNSGKCKPGCENGEVEVGSLSLGCKSGYQSACCTSSDVTKAYGECLWTDCLDNDDAKSACKNTMATSAQGWGGHKSCKTGKTRALCCPEEPPAPFATTCKWVPKNGHLSGGGLDNICEGACPQDAVKLSLSLGFHEVPGRKTACYGYNAFCCSDPSYIVPRDDDWEDSFGSMQAKEFKLLLEKYMENPTCPATILEPPIHDQFGGVAKKKRNLVVEAIQYDILQGRATDCTQANWEKMITYAALMYTMRDVGFEAVRSIYNDLFAGHYDEELEFESQDEFFHDNPAIDIRAHQEYIFLNPLDAGQGMRDRRDTATELCILPSARNSANNKRKELAGATDPAAKRFVWVGASGQSGVPNVETILQGILDGDLSLHYARWQWVRNRESGNQPGPMLELAYWIGPHPNIDTTGDARYNRYRDMRQRTAVGAGPDLWVGK